MTVEDEDPLEEEPLCGELLPHALNKNKTMKEMVSKGYALL